jgi:hypothetical protein
MMFDILIKILDSGKEANFLNQLSEGLILILNSISTEGIY